MVNGRKDIDGATMADSFKKEDIAVYDPIEPARASEVDIPFKAFLTFAIYDTKTIPSGIEYARQLYNPRNGEKKIIPISYSFDLIKALKRQEHPLGEQYILRDGPASINIIRAEDLKIGGYSGIGVLDLYRKFPNSDLRIEDMIISDVSRERQFQIAVPEENKGIIAFASGDLVCPDYTAFFFSKQHKKFKVNEDIGFDVGGIEKGEKVNITKEDLGDITDKIVVCFGSYIGEKGNSKRRFLMYITPNEIVPKLKL